MRRYHVTFEQPDGLDAFRAEARALIATRIPPAAVTWSTGESKSLFGGARPLPAEKPTPLTVPSAFLALSEDVVCHRDPERFALLYEALWRIAQGENALLSITADPLVHRLRRMQKAINHDLHKMRAFVRFRRIETAQGERFVAWFEPEHYIVRRNADFFVDRFAGMAWSILTPKGGVHWDRQALSFTLGVAREDTPRQDAQEDAKEDAFEEWWRSYYRVTFNPARVNAQAMRQHMPKRYWRNLPESRTIPGLLREAGTRTQRMVDAPPTMPRRAATARFSVQDRAADALSALKSEAAVCERCPLFCNATQTVFGEGPRDAPVVFVGEQPGDQEDLAGRPFVGPAGQVFDRALAQAGIDRARVYVTNAVKHFKYEPRGKRRLHKKPNNGEIEACRWWLEKELTLIKPRRVVALGATAARALTGRDVTIGRERGQRMTFLAGLQGYVTVHPSFLLRLPDARARDEEYARFVTDLRLLACEIPAIGKAA